MTSWALGIGPWGVGKDLPCPARTTLLAPRAMARLTLNVNGFNMGDDSPWQQSVQGDESGRPFHDAPSLGKSRRHPPAGVPAPGARAALPVGRHPPVGCSRSSPWHNLGEPLVVSSSPRPRLNALGVF